MMARRSNKMTILQLVPSLDVGGAERATVDIAGALVSAGHRALVMSSGGMMVESLVRGGAEHFEHAIGSKNPWSIWQNRRYLADFIKAKTLISCMRAAARRHGAPISQRGHRGYGS